MSQDKSIEGSKLWGGRFSGQTDHLMEAFNKSIGFDSRLWAEDIEGSLAYVQALEKVAVVTKEEQELITEGLKKVYKEWENKEFKIQDMDEDIHTANERRLKELIGTVGGKLHTGRSRNDQVATDVRLWLRKEIVAIKDLALEFLTALTERSFQEIDILMPGYTHLQRAQPIRWSHWLMSYGWALKRDAESLMEIQKRVNVLPLGSGALAGNPFGIDRNFIAQVLKFSQISENSLDGSSGRDFIAEFLNWSALTMIHFSKLSEDLILYSTKEFGFVTLSDAYSTGSSLMPQKKNPDSLELIRGKCGRGLGNCTGFMMTLKGLPSAFNKDLQEDKERLFDSVDTLKNILQIATGVISTLTVNREKCLAALSPDMLATDIAYYLVRKGVPFREAHCISGEVVHFAEVKGIPITKLSAEDMKSVNDLFEDDIKKIWDYEASVEQYSAAGGTSRSAVLEQIEKMRAWIKS